MAHIIIFAALEGPVLPRYDHPEVLAVLGQLPDHDLVLLHEMIDQMLLSPE